MLFQPPSLCALLLCSLHRHPTISIVRLTAHLHQTPPTVRSLKLNQLLHQTHLQHRLYCLLSPKIPDLQHAVQGREANLDIFADTHEGNYSGYVAVGLEVVDKWAFDRTDEVAEDPEGGRCGHVDEDSDGVTHQDLANEHVLVELDERGNGLGDSLLDPLRLGRVGQTPLERVENLGFQHQVLQIPVEALRDSGFEGGDESNLFFVALAGLGSERIDEGLDGLTIDPGLDFRLNGAGHAGDFMAGRPAVEEGQDGGYGKMVVVILVGEVLEEGLEVGEVVREGGETRVFGEDVGFRLEFQQSFDGRRRRRVGSFCGSILDHSGSFFQGFQHFQHLGLRTLLGLRIFSGLLVFLYPTRFLLLLNRFCFHGFLPLPGDSKSISKKLCDTISELASTLLPDNAWPELLPFMFQSVNSSDSPRLQESALLIFSRLAQFIGDALIPYLATLHSIFLHCLSTSSSPDVRIATLSAAVNFIQCLASPTDRDRFQDLLPPMMRTLTEALNSGQEATAQEALELLIELAGSEPKFLRHQLVDVVGSMLQIAEAERLEEGTRHLAIEFVITLAEARERAPGMMRKLPQFIGRLFAVLMKMLLDIEDDPAWHNAESEDEDAGETSNYSVGQECLDRLSISLGGNTIIPVASELLPVYFAAPEWQKHHAALITLAQIAEGCSKVMLKNLEQVVTMILSSFQDPHPRVRWAAINAIGQLSTDLGPDLQVQNHQRVLPALASGMDDFQNPRVQAHAASAILNFSENCTPDILTPYLDGIVSKLLVLLQNGKQMVQEAALTALASVADSSQEHFQKYYDAVMPYLKVILTKATDKSNRMLRAKSMECISLVGMAVGKDKFREDAKQVMEVLMSLQGSPTEADDPTTSYMLQAWARLCKCLGQDFLPYMSVVIPPLLESAQLKPDVTITSADSDDDIEESDDESIETITLGDKRIGIKTSVLEEKATACNMLCCYADELKEGFFPWIDQVAPTLVPLLKFYFHEEVRKAAVSAMPELLRSAKLAVEKGQAQGRDASYVKQLSDYIIPALVEALHKEPETEICATMLDSLNECIQISGSLLDESQVRSIVEEIKQVITASSTRKRERGERAKAEDFDAEEGELLKEENEQEEEVFDQVGDCLGTLIKIFKASFLPFFDEVSSYIMPMWGKDKTAEERRIAICIFDDVAEQCREAAVKYYDTFLPFLLEACNDENADVRQAAVYGVGVCAEFGGSAFKPLVVEALSRLNFVIRQPDALHPDNVMAYDNAVSAIGKICQFHRNSIDAAQVVPTWLSCLPIKGDLIEAKVVHDQLCSMVERSDMELLGPNNQFLPKIVTVFAEVLCAGKDLATEQTASRMISLLKQLQQTLPPSALASTWSSLQPQQQLALQSILSS